MYNDAFFEAMKSNLGSARRVLEVLHATGHMEEVKKGDRALDVGCGIGCWASAAAELGYDAFGMDGSYVPQDRLLIPKERFIPTNLEHPIPVKDHRYKYQLVMCLEVAEHLSPERAPSLIDELCEMTNGVLLFSAAIPGQGGEHHVNERWQSYWSWLLAKRLTPGTWKDHMSDAVTDVRPMFWGDSGVAWWYQQNMLVFHRSFRSGVQPTLGQAVNLVHPILYAMRAGVPIP